MHLVHLFHKNQMSNYKCEKVEKSVKSVIQFIYNLEPKQLKIIYFFLISIQILNLALNTKAFGNLA